MSDLREIQKPTPVSAIKVYAENFKGSITGEAFNDLFEYISEKEAEIERLRVKLTKTVEELKYVRLALSIAHDHGYDTEDRDIEKMIGRIDRSIRTIKGGETDDTQTSD